MKRKAKKMRTVRAWAHVTPTGEIADLALKLPLFTSKRVAKTYLCGMEKHGYRAARVEIRELRSKP